MLLIYIKHFAALDITYLIISICLSSLQYLDRATQLPIYYAESFNLVIGILDYEKLYKKKKKLINFRSL